MALYEYKCRDCGDVAEYLVFSQSEKVTCKKCGSENLDKLISNFAVSVKSGSSNSSGAECPYSNRCGGGGCGIQ